MAALYRLEDKVDVGELLQVWVSPDYRGTRLAWDLMDAIFQWASENNFHRIIAGVIKVNARALTFYIKYGFSTIDESSANDSDGVYLVKEVKCRRSAARAHPYARLPICIGRQHA